MFVYSMRATTLKFFGVVALSVITLIILIAVIPTFSTSPVGVDAPSAAVLSGADGIDYSGIKTTSDGAKFLSQYGWSVCGEVAEEKVRIPVEFDSVLDKYNEIQKRQGMDLTKYRNKTLVRYTYEVANFYEVTGVRYAETVYVTILTYRNKVVAGDVCSASPEGFVVGLDVDAPGSALKKSHV